MGAIKKTKAQELRNGRRVTIYGLRAKGSVQFLYVGATSNATRRKLNWKYKQQNSSKVLAGVDWEMITLENCALEHSAARESYWIKRLTREGHLLANKAKPGRNNVSPFAYAMGIHMNSDTYFRFYCLQSAARKTASKLFAHWVDTLYERLSAEKKSDSEVQRQVVLWQRRKARLQST